MKRLALAAAGAAVVGLTACSHTTAPTAASADHSTGTSAVPVSCSQQYQTWKHGPGKGLITTLHTASAASTTGDPQVLTATLKKVRPVVARASRYPVPACADPRGYWSALLMHMHAAVASKGSASSARAAMKGVAGIEHELTAELKATTQAK